MRFHARTMFERPGLHLWAPGTSMHLNLAPVAPEPDAGGWWQFAAQLDHRVLSSPRFLLYDRDARDDSPVSWEPSEHQREVPRLADGAFPAAVWFLQGAGRAVTAEPQAAADSVRIHLLTARRYRDGRLYVWRPGGEGRLVELADPPEERGPHWDLALEGDERRAFLFKFVAADGEYEPDYANRLWVADDGTEVWTHSRASAVSSSCPEKVRLRVHVRQELDHSAPPVMHAWQESSDFVTDVAAWAAAGGWFTADLDVYEHLPYGVLFRNPGLPGEQEWEHADARRWLTVKGDTEVWTLEGDGHAFGTPPAADHLVSLELSAVAPWVGAGGPLVAEVRVNRARAPLHERVQANGDGRPTLAFRTYPEVTTSVRLLSPAGEELSRHAVTARTGAASEGFVVVGIDTVLRERPPADLFADPPFLIERPGAYERDGELRFVLHAPDVARAQVVGEWTGWERRPLEMRLTRDGTYWWGAAPVAEVDQGLGGDGADYHGARYKFLLDGALDVQDPAAGWVEDSAFTSASRLVRRSAFRWADQSWTTPGFDHLLLYQLHPSRFSRRHADLAPFDRIAREVEDGWISGLGVTALMLMPVNEVGSTNSWGYDPAYFYSVENAYGGPDALKRLVDTCHRHGLAVLVDVVFNHAGSVHNILWRAARHSYFDGDTRWGALVNFDHPQCRHFFEQNLVYLHQEFHIDGFRLDHTHTIVHSHRHTDFVTQPGSGGGMEFLHGLRHALRTQGDPRCLLSAEHLPNEWFLTNYPGPMDSQWCDDFHDRLVDACRGAPVMPALAAAMRLSAEACDDWYKVVNYAESHDEVGNVPDRVANVAGWGRGLRMSKVAAAASVLSRGIPMFFMGAEAGEHRQFRFGAADALDLDGYEASPDHLRVRAWWEACCALRRRDTVRGPSPLTVHHADGHLLAFSRGNGAELFVLLNFGGWSGRRRLASLGLPPGTWRELWNSTWPAFAVESEGEHPNGGRDARLDGGHHLDVPDHGVVVLERV